MKEKRVEPMFGGFHFHVGEVVGCVGPRVEVPAAEHVYLVQEAERFGCRWLASLRHSHPNELMAEVPGDAVLGELDLLLGDATVDDRAREAAKRIRALLDRTEAARKVIVACGVGSSVHVEQAWTDPPPDGAGDPPALKYQPMIDLVGASPGRPAPATLPVPGGAAGAGTKAPRGWTTRIDFFLYGTVHRGPGPFPSAPVDVRGIGGMRISAWAGLDCNRTWAGATCWMEESEDGKTWVAIGDRLLPGAGRQAIAVFFLRWKWLRATVEVSDPEAQLPVSVHGWPLPGGPGGEPSR